VKNRNTSSGDGKTRESIQNESTLDIVTSFGSTMDAQLFILLIWVQNA
jgi:hypothetical protein